MGDFEGVFQTGTVPQYNGASGLLDTLLTFVLGTEVAAEVIATAANVNTTLASFPVAKGRLVVDYTISAVSYQATDDGSGNVVGTLVASGTIDYETGDIVITFTGTPTGDVTADYIYGTPGQDWKQEFKRNTTDNGSPPTEPFGSDCKEVILTSKGISGQEFVCIGIREWEYPAQNAYGWDLNGYTWYNDDMDWNASSADHGMDEYDSDWGHWDKIPTLPLLDDTMTYWFFANRQRIVVIVKNSAQYDQCYLGFGRRFANPSDYHYPLVVFGSLSGNYNYAAHPSMQLGIHDTHYASGWGYPKMCVGPGGIWSRGSGGDYQTTMIMVQPRQNWADDGTIAPSIAGRVMMTPVYLCKRFYDQAYMDLDGVHCVIGTGVQAEDTIRKGMRNSIIFPNVFNTAYHDNVAIEFEEITTTTTTTTTTT